MALTLAGLQIKALIPRVASSSFFALTRLPLTVLLVALWSRCAFFSGGLVASGTLGSDSGPDSTSGNAADPRLAEEGLRGDLQARKFKNPLDSDRLVRLSDYSRVSLKRLRAKCLETTFYFVASEPPEIWVSVHTVITFR
ncbi:hypothetical protein EYF80_042552 [Liparis tanakae]|uniref:Uncharacterized protein n=1 Tax=Liparis tanakae TaxID=230148 RepID=A0A4Z2G302_9TELE|nr:hypothetical protein EYF80_042552 [Liparis tanakae]